MTYLLLKAAHLLALIVWSATLLCLPPLIAWLGTLPPVVRDRIAQRLRRRARLVGTAAMLATWTFGLTLMMLNGWTGGGWIAVKLAFVVALSGAHRLCSVQLRRLAEDARHCPPSKFERLAAAELVALGTIAVLVVVQP